MFGRAQETTENIVELTRGINRLQKALKSNNAVVIDPLREDISTLITVASEVKKQLQEQKNVFNRERGEHECLISSSASAFSRPKKLPPITPRSQPTFFSAASDDEAAIPPSSIEPPRVSKFRKRLEEVSHEQSNIKSTR